MEDYPTNLLEFEKRFATEQACRQYFQKLRWPDGFQCPNCGNKIYFFGGILKNEKACL
jgi:hypothetical protein